MGAYVALATVLVWAPVALYWGRRCARGRLAGRRRGLENERLIAAVSLLVFGAILVLDGLVQLL